MLDCMVKLSLILQETVKLSSKWSRKRQPTPVFLPGKFHEQRSLAGYSPWGLKELDRIELLSTEHTCTIRIKLYETHCAKYAHDVASSSTMFTEYVNTL